MALNREQVQLKVKEILEKAKRENNVLTYQDMMNALAELIELRRKDDKIITGSVHAEFTIV